MVSELAEEVGERKREGGGVEWSGVSSRLGDGREGLLSAISRLYLSLHLGSVCRLGDGRVGVVHDAVEGVDRPQLEVGRLA